MDNRLKRKSDFDLLFRKGKRVYGKHLFMVYLKKKDLKIGFSVSKKNGGAVVRNRIKRLFRAISREFLPLLKDNYYIVFVPKAAEVYDYKELKRDVFAVLTRENMVLNDDKSVADSNS